MVGVRVVPRPCPAGVPGYQHLRLLDGGSRCRGLRRGPVHRPQLGVGVGVGDIDGIVSLPLGVVMSALLGLALVLPGPDGVAWDDPQIFYVGDVQTPHVRDVPFVVPWTSPAVICF